MAIVGIGTYTGVAHCFRISSIDESVGESERLIEIEPLFSDDSHTGNIKCLAICEKFMASSSSDESVRITHIKSKKEIGSLIKINDTVDMKFQSTKNLVTLSSDGYLRIWSTKNWDLVHQFHAHVVSGVGFSFFPGSCLALSVGGDKQLKLWDLHQMKLASTGTLTYSPKTICVSPRMDCYAVVFDRCLKTFDIRTNESQTITSPSPILSVDFLNENRLVFSGESKTITIYQMKPSVSRYMSWDIEYNRTRGLKVLHISGFGEAILTIHSEGIVVIWDARHLSPDHPPQILSCFPINGRAVCCAVYSQEIPLN